MCDRIVRVVCSDCWLLSYGRLQTVCGTLPSNDNIPVRYHCLQLGSIMLLRNLDYYCSVVGKEICKNIIKCQFQLTRHVIQWNGTTPVNFIK